MKPAMSTYCVSISMIMLVASVARADGYAKTKYPIFLAEGVGGLDYFGVAEALQDRGARVCSPPDDQVPQVAGSEARAAVLIEQIEACAAQYQVTKVNLIGYSQGGEDARVVLTNRPDLLASVTTVGTPHTGSSGIADRIIACGAKQLLGLPCAPDEAGALAAFSALAAVASDPDAPVPSQEAILQVQCQFSSGTNLLALAACAAAGFDIGPTFDLKYPLGLPILPCSQGPAFVLGPGFKPIYLYSWGGTRTNTDANDPSDALLSATAAYEFPGGDGLTERCSNHFGTVLRDNYPLNHLDLINQLGGETGFTDVLDIWVEHGHRLKLRGI